MKSQRGSLWRQWLATIWIGLLWSVLVHADDPAFQALLVTRGRELNAAYQNCLGAFPANLKEQLRIAQRAWIVFDNKNEAAFAAVGKSRGMSAEDLDRAGLPETVARAEILRTYFAGPNEDVAAFQRDLAQAEQELTAAYKQCLATLNHDQELKLRDTERAWIDYREKDIRAHAGDPSGRAALWTSVRLARRRTTQLREFYLQLVPSLPAGTATASTASTPPASPNPPRIDTAARTKAVAEFHHAVDSVLAQTVASGVLTEAKAADDVKELPGALITAIVDLGDKAAAFREKFDEDELHAIGYADLHTAAALMHLQKAVGGIKSGDLPGAKSELSLFHEASPNPDAEAQKPLWKTLDALRALCNDLAEQAKPHLQRARSAADAGQNGEAVKEYQQAYKIYPDPETAQTIKRLREDSLGL